MSGEMLLIGGSLLGIAAVSCWHIYENRSLARKLQTMLGPATAQWIVQFAWMRSIQLFAALACAAMLIISYDQRLTESQQIEGKLKVILTQKDALLQKQAEDFKKTQAKLQAQTPAPVTPKPTATPAPATAVPPISVEDVYNPEKSKTDVQSNIDGLKKRYENVLVLYLFLKRCNMATDSDSNIITHAIMQEITAIGADKRLLNDILSAAAGSYNEIYAKSTCTGNDIKTLQTQYADYLKVLSARFPMKTQNRPVI